MEQRGIDAYITRSRKPVRFTAQERLFRRIQNISLKQTFIMEKTAEDTYQVEMVPAFNRKMEVCNVLPAFGLGKEPLCVQVKHGITFIPGSKQALKKSLEMASGVSANKASVMAELTARRKTFCGYKKRRETFISRQTDVTLTRGRYGRRTEIEADLCGCEFPSLDRFAERIVTNDPGKLDFKAALYDRMKENGREFVYAYLRLPEFGLSELSWQEKLNTQNRPNYERAMKALGVNDTEVFNNATFIITLACLLRDDDRLVQNFTGILCSCVFGTDVVLGAVDADRFGGIFRFSFPVQKQSLNEVFGSSVVTPTDKGYGFLTSAYMGNFSVQADTGELARYRKIGLRQMAYHYVGELAERGNEHAKRLVEIAVEIGRLAVEHGDQVQAFLGAMDRNFQALVLELKGNCDAFEATLMNVISGDNTKGMSQADQGKLRDDLVEVISAGQNELPALDVVAPGPVRPQEEGGEASEEEPSSAPFPQGFDIKSPVIKAYMSMQRQQASQSAQVSPPVLDL